jgi:ribokinase
VVTPNETEAKVMPDHDPQAAIPPEKLATGILARGAKQVVPTLGGWGALVVTEFSEIHVPSADVPVVDTTGAGYAFNAGFGGGARERFRP